MLGRVSNVRKWPHPVQRRPFEPEPLAQTFDSADAMHISSPTTVALSRDRSINDEELGTRASIRLMRLSVIANLIAHAGCQDKLPSILKRRF